VAFIPKASAEGTKEFQPRKSNNCNLEVLNPNYFTYANNIGYYFGSYKATPEGRLHISIADPSREKIYFGFGYLYKNNVIDTVNPIPVYYRIKDPLGNVVYGPQLVPTSGQGFINTYEQAKNGPAAFPGNADSGYSALSYQPLQAGDYYIEFNPDNPTTPPAENVFNRNFAFRFFDITVSRDNQPRLGRVWSKNWNLNANQLSNPIYTKFYIYSTDSITTKIDCNGLRPFGFSVVCNRTGLSNTGLLEFDRQSREYNYFYPEYRIFLNNPDPLIFPDGKTARLRFAPRLSCQNDGNFCVSLVPDRLCYCDMYIELNGVDGYQPNSRDLRFNRFLLSGPNCVPWNGNDGLGNRVPNGTNLRFYISIVSGLTNLPLFDAELNPIGFKVERIRPSVDLPKIYWDDSKIPFGVTNLEGCADNCHPWNFTPGDLAWTGGFGDIRSINTWWTGFDRPYFFSANMGPCNNNLLTPAARLDSLTILAGTDFVVINPHINNTYPNPINYSSITIIQEPKKGRVQVKADGNFIYLPNPGVVNVRDTIYYFICDFNDPPLCVTDTILINIVDKYTIPNLVIPKGFSPNGDNINDKFIINNAPGAEISLQIYNRWGSLVYENNSYSPETAWDGVPNKGVQLQGGHVPDGVYFGIVKLKSTNESIATAITIKR